MLGIVIGVMSVVVIAAIGEGVRQQIGNQAARYGSSVLIARPDAAGDIGGSGLPGGASSLLTATDMDAIHRVPGVQSVVPISAVKGAASGDYTVNNPLVIATTYDLGTVINQKVEYGGFFTPADGEQVVVLGTDIAHQLFSDTAPLGQKLTFRGKQFVVAGVFKPFVAAPFSLEANYNQAIFMPYVAAQNILGGAPQINQLFIKAKPGVDTTALAKSVQTILTDAHGGTQDTSVLAPGMKGSSSDRTLRLLTMMTVGMAIVALIVGGVGIMNMMLVSVTERIHEIGLRKAIGATNHQILRQFVTEAFVLCLVGSVIGLFTSIVAVEMLRLYTSLQPVIVWWVALLASLISLVIGVLFGAIPALKAARMDPIEALRHE
jgi:ABC-type antimicrobial peptide transport system permease subunit